MPHVLYRSIPYSKGFRCEGFGFEGVLFLDMAFHRVSKIIPYRDFGEMPKKHTPFVALILTGLWTTEGCFGKTPGAFLDIYLRRRGSEHNGLFLFDFFPNVHHLTASKKYFYTAMKFYNKSFRRHSMKRLGLDFFSSSLGIHK